MESQSRPELADFLKVSREALGYLKDLGFIEVSPPADGYANPYQIWFKADDRFVIVSGEGWGDVASITLEHSQGLELSEIDLVPRANRPKRRDKRKKGNGQLQQVRDAAARLHKCGLDFLQGHLERFSSTRSRCRRINEAR